MTHSHEPSGRATPPSPADLFKSYLQRQTAAQAEGLGYPEPPEGFVPHEAVPVQPVDPQLAWNDALAAAKFFQPSAGPKLWAVPPDWPVLVTSQEPAVALAFCLGNFPQLVRNLHPLLSAEPPALRAGPGEPLSAPALLDWARQAHAYPQALLAAGVLRLARHFDDADELLRAEAPPAWQAARANEEAGLAWHRGQAEKALRLWQAQDPTVPVLFNRGMASLFLGHPAEARDALSRAAGGLPETSAWHHLAQLYLALANARGQ
jgi:hypothetical protein